LVPLIGQVEDGAAHIYYIFSAIGWWIGAQALARQMSAACLKRARFPRFRPVFFGPTREKLPARGDAILRGTSHIGGESCWMSEQAEPKARRAPHIIICAYSQFIRSNRGALGAPEDRRTPSPRPRRFDSSVAEKRSFGLTS
jgi:hypothetical protein